MGRGPSQSEQLIAWTIAHRSVLHYLVKAVAMALPEEGEPKARDATVTMLHNGILHTLANFDKMTAARIDALAKEEIDRIFLAPLAPMPPSEGA